MKSQFTEHPLCVLWNLLLMVYYHDFQHGALVHKRGFLEEEIIAIKRIIQKMWNCNGKGFILRCYIFPGYDWNNASWKAYNILGQILFCTGAVCAALAVPSNYNISSVIPRLLLHHRGILRWWRATKMAPMSLTPPPHPLPRKLKRCGWRERHVAGVWLCPADPWVSKWPLRTASSTGMIEQI